MRARRLIVGLAALFLLAGCDFSGTLVIGADDRVTADVTMWIDYGPEVSVDENGNETLMPPRPGCEVLSFPIEGLVGTSEVNAKDPSKVGCRWTGVTTMQALQSTEPAAGFLRRRASSFKTNHDRWSSSPPTSCDRRSARIPMGRGRRCST